MSRPGVRSPSEIVQKIVLLYGTDADHHTYYHSSINGEDVADMCPWAAREIRKVLSEILEFGISHSRPADDGLVIELLLHLRPDMRNDTMKAMKTLEEQCRV